MSRLSSRSARLPELIALRRWARRLDREITENSRLIAQNERVLQFIRGTAGVPDSLREAS